MNMILLSIIDNAYVPYFIFGVIGLIIWYFLLRSAVRSDSIVKNQEAIIHILIQQFKKQATEEEMQELKKYFGIK